MKTQFPRENLPASWFAGGANLGAFGVETLVKFLNELRSEKRMRLYPVSKTLPGAFKSVEDAVGLASLEVPVTVPRTPVLIFLDPSDWHEVDIDLPLTHSWYFDGGSFSQPFYGSGGLVGRIGTPSQKQSASNPELNRVVFRNLTIGNGGYTPGTSGFILQADVGWNVAVLDSLIVGGIFELYSDPLITGPDPYNSSLFLTLRNIANNGAFAVKYAEPARTFPNPPTSVLVDRCSMLAGDGEFGDFPGSWRLDGVIDIRISNSDFQGFAEAGPGIFKGIGAAPCSGFVRFLNSHLYALTLFAQMNCFGANIAAMTFEWGEGSTIEEVNYGLPAPAAINLAGVTHRKAPIVVSRTVPLSPPRGTVRRDENATEKYLFWNGAAWV